jgi:hypothetical protein
MSKSVHSLLSEHTYPARAEARCAVVRRGQRLRGILKGIPVGVGQAAELRRRKSLEDARGWLGLPESPALSSV